MTLNSSPAVWWASSRWRLPLTPVMSVPNSGMTIHTLVLTVDSFSCNCNSIDRNLSKGLQEHFSLNSSYCCLCINTNVFSNVITSTLCSRSLLEEILQCTYLHLCLFHSKSIRYSTVSTQLYGSEEIRIKAGEIPDKLVEWIQWLANSFNFPTDAQKERYIQFWMVCALSDIDLIRKLYWLWKFKQLLLRCLLSPACT